MTTIPNRTSHTLLLAFMHYKSDKSIYALALCYSLISVEKLTNTKKENNHYVVNIKRSSLLYDAFKTVKY